MIFVWLAFVGVKEATTESNGKLRGCDLWRFCVVFQVFFDISSTSVHSPHYFARAHVHDTFVYRAVIHLDTAEYVQQEEKDYLNVPDVQETQPWQNHSHEKIHAE